MSTAEIMWLVHHENINAIRDGDKRKMRRYLTDSADEDMLEEWDREQMKSAASSR